MDNVRPSLACGGLNLAKPAQQEDQAVVLRDVIAPQAPLSGFEIWYVTHDSLPADHVGGPHRSFLSELISGTRSVEETFRAGGIGSDHLASGSTWPRGLKPASPPVGFMSDFAD